LGFRGRRLALEVFLAAILLFQVGTFSIPTFAEESSSGITIPDWIKTTSGWWAEGMVTDKEFVDGLEFMIKNEFIKSPTIQVVDSSDTSQTQKGEIVVPEWIKNNAGWWTEGLIGDSDFILGIEFMIKNEFISSPNISIIEGEPQETKDKSQETTEAEEEPVTETTEPEEEPVQETPEPVEEPVPEPTGPEMDVLRIDTGSNMTNGDEISLTFVVYVHDKDENPVSDAKVVFKVSYGLQNIFLSGVTQSDGGATIETLVPKCNDGKDYIGTVTKITKAGITYNPAMYPHAQGVISSDC